MNKLFNKLLLIIISILACSCATMMEPSGGEKDTTPPVAKNFSEKNGKTNFTKNKVVITFDEYIVLDKLTQQLVVSPPMKKMPDVFAQGKKLIINLPDSLKSNTTYSIFFGDAIRNFTENLPIHNFSYIFSTGPVVDSLQIKGKAINAFDHKPYEELLVMLYKNKSDSVLTTEKPYYLTKTDINGNFTFNNLSEGDYQIYALKDLNRNYIFDQEDEEIAFCDSLVKPSQPLTNINKEVNLFVFKNHYKKTNLISSSVYSPTKLFFKFNNSVNNLKLIPLNFTPDSNWYFNTYSKNNDSIYSYLMGIKKDTIRIALLNNQIPIDTLQLTLVKKRNSNAKSNKHKKTNSTENTKTAKNSTINFSTNLGNNFAFFNPIEINFRTPLIDYNKNKIHLFKLNDVSWQEIPFESYFTDSTNHQKIAISAPLEEITKYQLLIIDSCFTDIYGFKNDSLVTDFTTNDLSSYGSLKLNIVNNFNKPLIIQLLDSKNFIVNEQSINNSTTITYPHLSDGKYIVKAIIDENGNKKWDNGNFEKRQQPEKVLFLNQIIDIRANWDNDQTWNIEK